MVDPSFTAARLPLRSLGLVLALLLVQACKSPRTSPHRVAEDDVTGVWRAQSTEPAPAGWSLRLEQMDAGNIEGRGSLTRTEGTTDFSVKGLRGPRDIKMEFDLDRAPAAFDGSVMNPETMVGRLYLGGDTIKLTFERD